MKRFYQSVINFHMHAQGYIKSYHPVGISGGNCEKYNTILHGIKNV